MRIERKYHFQAWQKSSGRQARKRRAVFSKKSNLVTTKSFSVVFFFKNGCSENYIRLTLWFSYKNEIELSIQFRFCCRLIYIERDNLNTRTIRIVAFPFGGHHLVVQVVDGVCCRTRR